MCTFAGLSASSIVHVATRSSHFHITGSCVRRLKSAWNGLMSVVATQSPDFLASGQDANNRRIAQQQQAAAAKAPPAQRRGPGWSGGSETVCIRHADKTPSRFPAQLQSHCTIVYHSGIQSELSGRDEHRQYHDLPVTTRTSIQDPPQGNRKQHLLHPR